MQWWLVAVLVSAAGVVPGDAASVAGLGAAGHTQYGQAPPPITMTTTAAAAAFVCAAAFGAALFGCVSSSRASVSSSGCTCKHCEFHAEKVFAEADDAEAALIERRTNELDAVYNVLSKDQLLLHDIEKDLAAQRKALETTREEYKEYGQARIDADEAKRVKQAERCEVQSAYARKLRSAAGADVMPAAKRGETAYNEKWAAALAADGGQGRVHAVQITEQLAAKAKAAPTPPPGQKAARQPQNGLLVSALQQLGLVEAGTLWRETIIFLLVQLGMDVTEAGGACTIAKDASRANIKSLRWGGECDPTNVSDWGRGTSIFKSLKQVNAFLPLFFAAIAAKGYTVVSVKHAFDPAKSASKSNGYRNILMNLACPSSGHVIEVQLNLAPIETIKHSPIGHRAYELLRKCGYGDRTEYAGNFNDALEDAIANGRALVVQADDTDYAADDGAVAVKLRAAFRSAGCRVERVSAEFLTGAGKAAACVEFAAAPTVRSLE